jgi:hypothetical protein
MRASTVTLHQSIAVPRYLVLVVVIPMGGMVVPVMHVVHVVSVVHGVMAAAWVMGVLVAGMGYMRERVLVVVALM